MGWMIPAAMLASTAISAGYDMYKNSGNDEKQQQISNLTPSQQRLQRSRERAVRGRGAPGAYGDVADYYRDNLSDTPEDYDAFAAPELRRYNQQIIPDLAEQFAGMGSGGLSSSGFRNAAVNAGTDLSERLGALRAELRQRSAQGLQNLSEGAIQPNQQSSLVRPPAPGFMESAAPGVAQAGTQLAYDYMKQNMNQSQNQTSFGTTSPYGKVSRDATDSSYGSYSNLPVSYGQKQMQPMSGFSKGFGNIPNMNR